MATVGKLTVQLTALTGRFSKGMRLAAKEVRTLTGVVSAAGARLNAFGGIATLAAAGALGFLTHRAAEAIDVTAKMADRIGTSTEALIGMRHAANLAGVGAEEFDGALTQLSKRLGAPTEAVEKALESIGLSTGALFGKDPAKQFGMIADGVNKLATQEQKAAVAAALFGKQGVVLLNTLELGSRGLADAATEAERLGLAFSRVDAAKVEEANDAVTKLRSLFDAVFQKLSIELAPFVTELAERFIGLGTDGTSAADAIAGGLRDMARGALRIVDVVDVLAAAFQGLIGVFQSLSAAWDRVQFGVTKGVVAVANTLKTFSGLGLFVDDIELGPEFGNLLVSAAEKDQKAVEAFAKSRERLAAAIEGERSGSAMKTFDDIRKGANQRAEQAVKDRAQAKETATRQAGIAAIRGTIDQFMRMKKAIGDGLTSSATAKSLVDGIFSGGRNFFGGLLANARQSLAGMTGMSGRDTAARGTFSGDVGGRMTSQITIQQKQLDQQRLMVAELQRMSAALGGGVPLP